MPLYVDPNTGRTSATQDSTFSQNLDTWTPGQTTTPAPTPVPVATPASTAPVISTSDVVSPASDVASTAKKQQKDLQGIQTALQDKSLYEKTASDGFINAAFNAKYGRNANLEELGYTKVTDPKLLSGFTEEQLRREKDGSIYLKPGVGKASNYSLYGAKVIDVVKRLGLDSYLQDYGMGDTGKTDTATGAAPEEGETVEPEKPKTLLEEKEDIINNYFGNRNAERDKLKAEAGVAGIEAEINNASTIANQLMEKVEKMTTDLDMQDILNVETQIALKDKIEGRNIPMSSINSQLTKGMEDLTQDQRIKRLYDVYEVNTMINAQNAANRNVQLAQGKYDRAMETVREGIEDWATMQGMKLDLLTEMGQLEKEEKAKLQAEIDYERNLGLEGYTYVESTETYNKIVKELGITASTFSQFFYKDPANGKIYLKPSANGEDFTLSPGQIRYNAKGDIVAVGAQDELKTNVIGNQIVATYPDGTTSVIFQGEAGADPYTIQQVFANTMNFRKDYLDESKEFKTVQNSYNRVKASATNPSPAGDLALIFNYMKMLDPGSVVREGEFATAQNTAGVEERIRGLYNRVMSGERLAESQRADFSGRAKMLFDSQVASQRKRQDENRASAEKFGLDAELAVPDLIEREPLYKTMDDFLKSADDEQLKSADELKRKYNLDDYELLDLINDQQAESMAFNSVGGDTDKATLKKLAAKPDGTKGGQCGRFVNQLTGLGVGDSYQSKMAKMDKSIKYPAPGMVFTMPYKDTGHIGFIVGVEGDRVKVKDSNYGLDEKISTHYIPLSKITGLARV